MCSFVCDANSQGPPSSLFLGSPWGARLCDDMQAALPSLHFPLSSKLSCHSASLSSRCYDRVPRSLLRVEDLTSTQTGVHRAISQHDTRGENGARRMVLLYTVKRKFYSGKCYKKKNLPVFPIPETLMFHNRMLNASFIFEYLFI